MTPERKAELRKAYDALPSTLLYTEDYEYESGDLFVVESGPDGTCVCGTRKEYAEFFVLATTAVPELLDEVERLEKKLQSQLCTMKTVRDFIADDLPYVAQNILEATLEAADA